jgi:hypothetical protein
MKAGGRKRYRGVDKTNLESLDEDFVEVPNKGEIAKSNLMKASLNHGFPSNSKTPNIWSHCSVTTHSYSCGLA